MSGRALRRLREERDAFLRQKEEKDQDEDDDEDEDDSESEEDVDQSTSASTTATTMEYARRTFVPRNAGFTFVNGDFNDSESDSSDSESCDEQVNEHENEVEDEDVIKGDQDKEEDISSNHPVTMTSLVTAVEHHTDHIEYMEDLDLLLAEFEVYDKKVTRREDNEMPLQDQEQKQEPTTAHFKIITTTLDTRDMDFDYAMRTTLLGRPDLPEASSTRRSRTTHLFGPPREAWKKPPHYVAGGIGMTSYDETPNTVPWPYTTKSQKEDRTNIPRTNPKQWFTFKFSETYIKQLEDYRRIQRSSDANALAIYVAHNPYVTEALLQLAAVLYQTNQSQDGLSLLRRALWILECSSVMGFQPHKLQSSCFLDKDRMENECYFSALFRLLQVSSVAGCIRTSLAISRYILAMDPLRDPMGVLLIMDCFALQTMSEENCQFIIDIVESNTIQVHYRDDSTRKDFVGHLLDLPNWRYSYALAFYRLGKARGDKFMDERANEEIQRAVRQFPAVVEQLLVRNELDRSGRSFRTDWPTVLAKLRSMDRTPPSEGFDPIMHHATSQVAQLIIKIFVERNSKLWSSINIVNWIYDASAIVTTDLNSAKYSLPMHPSILRYSRIDPTDYEERFRHLPPEVNPLDPNLVATALVVDPNRRRLFRGGDGVARGGDDGELDLLNQGWVAGQGLMIGGRPTNIIDPDDPMLEVFLRSLLPWNHVGGIPPPRR